MEPAPRLRLWLFVALVAGALLIATRSMCLRAYLGSGVVIPKCPDGDLVPRLFVESSGLRRGSAGQVRVGLVAHYALEADDEGGSAPVRRFDTTLALVEKSGSEQPLTPVDGFARDPDHAARGHVVLPDVPDGDYLLRARVSSPLGEHTIDAPLPVYAPARVHVITDRPIYEPGNTIQFRAVVLRAKDLAPLDGRPGRFEVTDPTGERVLEEKAPAGDFGVASGTFPLDLGASVGDWRVRWVSGAASDEVTVRVEPFTLPRFSVEAAATKAFHRRDERPVVRGRVRYSSGAPVRAAELELQWTVLGSWPPPAGWLSGELPRSAVADEGGRFELELPRVPKDLRGRVTLLGRIAATDTAQDRVEGAVSVLLAEDAIDVSAVTELQGGLVQGASNRVYLRATTAAGAVLRETSLIVRRAWDPSDRGTKAVTDVDGVASIQLDPGPPVNVVVPPLPYRPPPSPPAVVRGEVIDLVHGRAPSLGDLRALDAWNAALAPCARFVESGSEVATLTVRVDPSGIIGAVAAEPRSLGRCLVELARSRRLTPGPARVLQLSFVLTSDLPRLTRHIRSSPSVPEGLEAALQEAALDARSCLGQLAETAPLPRLLLFGTTAGARAVDVRFVPDPEARAPLAEGAARCVEARFQRLELVRRTPEDAGAPPPIDALGVVHLLAEPRQGAGVSRPMATTRLGYELAIEARAGEEVLGSTTLFIEPGQVPNLRLRATPVLAAPGEEVEVALLRGPEFQGTLPEKLWLVHERGAIEGVVDPKLRVARFRIPDDGRGWFSVETGGARALAYVRPGAELEVAVRARSAVYAPGDRAILDVTTQRAGKGAPAAVALLGVDQSLGQIASLPGPDDLARLRPRATMRAPAFGVLDAAALEMGRVRGAAAAQAIVVEVASLPARVELDASVSLSFHPTFEPVEALTDHFYPVLSELHERVRTWEARSAKDERMEPRTLARLWGEALDAAEAKKHPVTDAYGRKLRLHALPDDLLALTDPRVVVLDATRLPEDVENWSAWVREERP